MGCRALAAEGGWRFGGHAMLPVSLTLFMMPLVLYPGFCSSAREQNRHFGLMCNIDATHSPSRIVGTIRCEMGPSLRCTILKISVVGFAQNSTS